MGIIVKYKADRCFLMDAANTLLIMALGVLSEDVQNIIKIYLSDTSPAGNLKTKLLNKIIIYRNANIIIILSYLFNKFFDMFKDIKKVVEILENK